jgi:hypothetical protein
LVSWLVSCTPRTADSPPVEGTGESVEEPAPVPRDRTFDPVSVQFHVVGETPRKPPLVELKVDIVILNHASESRWVLLPRRVGERPLEGGGVDVLEVERWGGRVLVGNWLGTGGFRAVRIGADGDVRLAGVSVQWWRKDTDPPADQTWMLDDGDGSLEALAARELLVDGKRAAGYFASDPTAPAASGPLGGAAPPEAVATVRHRADHAEVAAELVEPIEVRHVPWPRD